MSDLITESGRRIAYRHEPGAGPVVVFCGTKAMDLQSWARVTGRAFLRFDYSGHGQSSGNFRDGTITDWAQDAVAVISAVTSGPLILVGSSMGGWIACLAALSRPERVKAMVLIAPAPDFTEKLMKPSLPPAALEALARDGVWTRPSEYDDFGYPITRGLLEDGARWQILDGPIAIGCPVRILQGGADSDVPSGHSLHLVLAMEGRDVTYTLIKDGDHRLSRPQDIERLLDAVEEVL